MGQTLQEIHSAIDLAAADKENINAAKIIRLCELINSSEQSLRQRGNCFEKILTIFPLFAPSVINPYIILSHSQSHAQDHLTRKGGLANDQVDDDDSMSAAQKPDALATRPLLTLGTKIVQLLTHHRDFAIAKAINFTARPSTTKEQYLVHAVLFNMLAEHNISSPQTLSTAATTSAYWQWAAYSFAMAGEADSAKRCANPANRFEKPADPNAALNIAPPAPILVAAPAPAVTLPRAVLTPLAPSQANSRAKPRSALACAFLGEEVPRAQGASQQAVSQVPAAKTSGVGGLLKK